MISPNEIAGITPIDRIRGIKAKTRNPFIASYNIFRQFKERVI